jgi:hypothetical protein
MIPTQTPLPEINTYAKWARPLLAAPILAQSRIPHTHTAYNIEARMASEQE